MSNYGYIYLLRLEQDLDPLKCVYKIGRTTDLKARYKMIGVLMPHPVTLVWATPTEDTIESERIIHEVLKPQRMNGEWFQLDEWAIRTFIGMNFPGDPGPERDAMIGMFFNKRIDYDFFCQIQTAMGTLMNPTDDLPF